MTYLHRALQADASARDTRKGCANTRDERGPTPSEFLLYQTEDGLSLVQIRLHDDTAWLTQKQLAELYLVSVPSISEHILNISSEGDVALEATVRKVRTARTDEGHSDEAVREVKVLAKRRPTKRKKDGG